MFITRHFKKVYIFTICILIISLPSFAHECRLKDTTPKEITIYNTCLSHRQPECQIYWAILSDEYKDCIVKIKYNTLCKKI